MTNPHKDERDILDRLDDFDGLLHSRQNQVIQDAHDEIKALRYFAWKVAHSIMEEPRDTLPSRITDLTSEAIRLFIGNVR